MEFEFNLKALKVLGFLVPTDKRPSCLHRLWNVVTLLQLVILHALIVIDFVAGLSPTMYARVLSSFHMMLGTIVVFRTIATFLRVGSYTMNKKSKGTIRFILYITWWPTNVRETPTYYFIILWQGFTATFTLAVLTITDAFTCALLLAASARAEFLSRTISRALQPNRYNKHQLSRSFRAWLMRHQRYLAMMEQLNVVAGPMVFIAHLTTLLMCIVFSYVIYKISDTIMAGMLMGLNLGALIQLAIMSYAGQHVIDTSARLNCSIMHASRVQQGLLSRGPNRSAFQVLMTRTSVLNDRCSRVSGIGFFTVSMEFFSSVLSASMSYLLFLLQFKSAGPKVIQDLNDK
ncbi:Odorant receptor 42 [Ephemera danica]|nr:Odorant receptor 42 [Ephemera danica]